MLEALIVAEPCQVVKSNKDPCQRLEPLFPTNRTSHHLHDTSRCAAQVVASSLVCLPALDAGGAGPKAESWAFATDLEGLQLLMQNHVFGSRSCKLCDDGVVVLGEYGLTNVLMSNGYSIATLMARYSPVRPQQPAYTPCKP